MIYIADIHNLSDKDYNMILADVPDILLLFAKKDATIPVTKAVQFSSIAAVVKEFKILEAESTDLKAYYIGKEDCSDGVRFLTDLGFSDEFSKHLCPSQKKKRTTKNPGRVSSKVTEIQGPVSVLPTSSNTNSKVEMKLKPDKNLVLEPEKVHTKEESVGNDTKNQSKKPTQEPRKARKPRTSKKSSVTEPLQQTSDVTETEPKSNSDERQLITTFIKQMSVRSRDLKHFAGTDELLSRKIAGLLKHMDPSTDLMALLETGFDTDDSKIIYDWIKPNLKRLIQLSEQINP